VQRPDIRARLVSHLLNVDGQLAKAVADGLGLQPMPKRAEVARPCRTELQPSPALSMLLNPPTTFEGRKVGALITEGVSINLVTALEKALDKEGSALEFIAPTIAGVKASDGSWIEAHQAIRGGPSVLFDAVALLISEQHVNQLTDEPAARDFVADAYAHAKFIAYTESAKPFLTRVVAADKLDDGFIEIKGVKDISTFIEDCRKLRFWERETSA
jgi:catalase